MLNTALQFDCSVQQCNKVLSVRKMTFFFLVCLFAGLEGPLLLNSEVYLSPVALSCLIRKFLVKHMFATC